MWHKTRKKLPKKTDYYLISDGKIYSVGIFCSNDQFFIDRNRSSPILHENVKYWKKIPIVPGKFSNLPNSMLHF